jgi:lipoprotein-anchoring transpeptidase ErfK/SrfK
MKSFAQALLIAVAATALCQCSSTSVKRSDVVVSVADQKMGIYNKEGRLVTTFPISTSKFGIGDKPGSCCTPLGKHQVVAKIGHGLPAGAVLKSRQWNGEVVKPNAPGRDPIVSRILWLSGMEGSNRNAFNRFIYIHGTTEENRLGAPASYGCVRMAAKDVIRVFEQVPIGATVTITKEQLPKSEATAPAAAPSPVPVRTPANQERVIVSKDQPAERKQPTVQQESTGHRQRLVISVTS